MAKLYARKSDGTYVPYNPQSVTNIDVVQTTGDSVTAAMSQDAVTKELATKQETLTPGNGISIKGGVISSTIDSLITPITYAELVALRDSSSLVVGMQYRITDYTCTTTTSGTKSAEHVFDIIVTADSESTLNEVARAIQHEGDTYFADCDLNAWKLWYSLDNNTTRFIWADVTNGKGVIYRMIDEFNNDVPYDFKNIQFYRKWDSSKSLWSTMSSNNAGVLCYTFSSIGNSTTTSFTDYSLNASNKVYSNVIKKYLHTDTNKQMLNNICFFGRECYSNTFGIRCHENTFGNYCNGNTFGNNCYKNTFVYSCYFNTFGNSCSSNSFGSSCSSNTFGDDCDSNSFGSSCVCNSFGNSCRDNRLGNYCSYNSFGNDCRWNSFRASASVLSSLKHFVRYNHFDDGCSYNVIWNSNTTSSSVLLKNININMGVVGTSSSCNMINIDVLNSEQEINVNQVNGNILISNLSDITNKLDKTIEINYVDLVTLRDNAQLIPGQKYHIIDYITKTSQENTKSAGHQFDIIVTALNESTLSEEAQAIQHSNDEYFSSSNLSAWKIWYCLDNDTNRFAWAGDEKIDEIKYTSYDSSKCTINPELINSNAFITPFNFESCVWVDGNNDGDPGYGGDPNHDISELIYEWGYFTDENGVKQLCIYKSDARYYEEEGQPDYGDKYLYRGVVNVDGTEYDYWQKWDANSDGGGVDINGTGDYVYATTPRIVSNPEAYNVIIKTEGIYEPGKGVIYRMIDEWNNDVPYDFKNIQFARDWSVIAPDSGLAGTIYCYTFSVFLDGFSEDATANDESIKVKECIESDGDGMFGNNVIKKYQDLGICSLNDIVFHTDWSNESVYHYDNTFGPNCYSNTFGFYCYSNTFGNYCNSNTFGNGCNSNTFGSSCSSNTFGDNCYSNTFGNSCDYNSFGNSCYNNTFRDKCYNNTFGDNCYSNTFEGSCDYIRFAPSSSVTTKYNYYRQNHFGDGCQFILFKGAETASSSAQVQNYNFAQGLQGTSSAYIEIDGVRSRDYETKVAKNSSGELKIYCEADLIA